MRKDALYRQLRDLLLDWRRNVDESIARYAQRQASDEEKNDHFSDGNKTRKSKKGERPKASYTLALNPVYRV